MFSVVPVPSLLVISGAGFVGSSFTPYAHTTVDGITVNAIAKAIIQVSNNLLFFISVDPSANFFFINIIPCSMFF